MTCTLGSGAWSTYAHDAQRTSASDGCVTGAPTMAWRFPIPAQPANGRNSTGSWVPCPSPAFLSLHTAIADGNGAYISYSQKCNTTGIGATNFLMHVDGAMGLKWAAQMNDAGQGHWPTFGLGFVALADDGLVFYDPMTGKNHSDSSWDIWGDLLFDGTQLYVANTNQEDGPGIFLAALGANGCGTQCDSTCGMGCKCAYPATCPKALWSKNAAYKCKRAEGDAVGSLAFDAGTLFQAATYSHLPGTTDPASGLYAFDASGQQKWFQPAISASNVSASGGHVYLVEGSKLMARQASDGAPDPAWTSPPTLNGPSGQAPAIAGGLVIVADDDGVAAFDATSGKVAWKAPLVGVASPLDVKTMSTPTCFASGSGASLVVQNTTTLAVATGSGTVVAVGSAEIQILRLTDGSVVWSGAPTGITGALRNPVIVGKRLYMEDDGALVAFDAP